MPNAMSTPRTGAPSSHLRICTSQTCAVPNHLISTHHHKAEEGQTLYNKRPKARLHEQARRYHHSRHLLERAIGSLHQLSADRPVRLNRTLTRRITGAGRIVRSVRRMFWRCLTILHGARAYAGVSHKGGAVDHLKIIFYSQKDCSSNLLI